MCSKLLCLYLYLKHRGVSMNTIDDYVVLDLEETEKLKSIQIKLLRAFLDICKKENFIYFAVGGTALGAVRHHGYIPWDDDIDLIMPRSDYNRFLKVAPKYLSDDIFLQHNLSDMNLPINYAKLRDNNSTFIERSCKNIKMNHGVYIDIFPADGYPNSWIKQKVFNFKNRMLKERIRSVFYTKGESAFAAFIHKSLSLIASVFYSTPFEAVTKRDKLFSKNSYESSDYIANYCGAWGKREIVPKSWFGDGATVLFENIELVIPKEYDKYLTRLYGDYMEFPPVNKRISHHYCTIIDLDRSFQEYVNIMGEK